MSIKIYNKNKGQWEKHSTLLARSILVADGAGSFESDNVEGCLAELQSKIDTLTKDVKYIYENGTLGGGTGGGGGGASVPVISFEEALDEQGYLTKVVKSDEEIILYYFFNSPNPGRGVVTLTNGANVITESIKQGRNRWKIGKMPRGTHYLSITVEDIQGFVSEPARIKIISGALEIQSTFSDEEDFTLSDNIKIPYRVETEIPGTITAVYTLDGVETEKIINKGDNFWTVGYLPTFGVHKASIHTYCDTAVSNKLDFTLVVADSDSLFVSSTFEEPQWPQSKRLQIDYRISMKNQYQFKSNLYLDDALIDTVKNPSGVSYWDLGTNLSLGLHKVKIESMTMDEQYKDTLEIEFEIVEAGLIAITEPTNGLIAKFDASGMNNNSLNKNVWVDKTENKIQCHLHNFNYATNGWLIDEDINQTALVFNGKTYAEIDLAPFQGGVSVGLTVDILFKVENAGNMDAKVINCKNPVTPFQGFMIDTEKAQMSSRQAVQTYHQEGTWTRHTFVIDRVDKEIRTYTNAIISNASQIASRDPSNDEWAYNGKIILGASHVEDGDVKNPANCAIRMLRIYDRALTPEEILDVHMYDIKDPQELEDVYNLNYGETAMPTMMITGIGIEDLEPDQGSITVKVDYNDPVNPSKRFTLDLCQLEIQGTTSRYYPVKNYTLWLRNNDGQPKRDYTPNDAWLPEDRWTLKTNYMDSSHANNVGLQKYLRELMRDKPYPQEQVNPATRPNVDGIPIKVFINGQDAGVYTWNLDRYAYNNYGFATYNDDGTMNRHTSALSYEGAVNSTTGAGAFNSDEWDSVKVEWKHRYNYRGDEVTMVEGNDTVLAPGRHTELVELISWVKNADDNTFYAELDDHFSIPHLIDYYLFVYAFGMIDNFGKNMVISTYGRNEAGNLIWYPSFYDCDSVLGLANNGELRYDAGVDMDREAYNTKNSALWTKLKRCFPQEIKDRYAQLRRERNIDGEILPPLLSVETAMQYLDGEIMSRIGHLDYNRDAERKYLNPDGYTWLIACNGTRKEYTRRWLEERFLYLDSVYEFGDFNNNTMVLRTNVLGNVTVQLQTYSPMMVRINYTSSSSAKFYCSKDRLYSFTIKIDNETENDFTIYGAHNLMYVQGIENLNVSHVSIAGAKKLIELDVSKSNMIKGLSLGENDYLQSVKCNDCKQLGIEATDKSLDLRGCTNLRTLHCHNTLIETVQLPDTGGVLEDLNLSNTKLTTFEIAGQEYLGTLELSSCSQLSSLIARNCNGLKHINMPDTILETCIIEGCENVESIDISNTKFLQTIDLRGCPNLKKLSLEGVLSKSLVDLDLSSSLNLQELNISSMPYLNYVTFGRQMVNGVLTNFNALTNFKCSNSGIKSIRFGNTTTFPDYLNLQGFKLNTVSFQGCSNLVHVKNLNADITNPSYIFSSCTNLTTIEGNLTLRGSADHPFAYSPKITGLKGKLNLNLTYLTSDSRFACSCVALTRDDIIYIISKFGASYTGGWRSFNGCTGYKGTLPSNMFSHCASLNHLQYYFEGCTGITGSIPQGFFSSNTKLSDVTHCFNNCIGITGSLPGDLFKSAGTSLSNVVAFVANTRLNLCPDSDFFKYNTGLTIADSLFNGVTTMVGEIPLGLFNNKPNLNSIQYCFANTKIYGALTKQFFNTGGTNLRNILQCLRGTDVTLDLDANPDIFQGLPNLTQASYILSTGKITGQIPANLFSKNKNLTDVSGLFSGQKITGSIPSTLFSNNPQITNVSNLFSNTNIDGVIPIGLFDKCVNLNNVSYLFSGCKQLTGQIPERISTWSTTTNADGEVIEVEKVTQYGIFDKATKLSNVEGAFRNCVNLVSTIPSTLLMAGAELLNVNSLFAGCVRLYGQLPEELFKNCPKLMYATSTFADCRSLGKKALEVTEEDPYAIPERFFYYNTNLRSVSGMFSMWGEVELGGVVMHGKLPDNLFRTNVNLENASSFLAACSNIVGDLSGSFFINNTKLTNCHYTFSGCSINNVGSNLLQNNPKINDISFMFSGCDNTMGPAPKLWTTPAKVTEKCFSGCNFSDQADIPATYK